jgi:hypothetical protein
LNGASMEDVSSLSRCASHLSCRGVYSPFETTDDDVDELNGVPGRSPSLPVLSVTSEAISDFQKNRDRPVLESKSALQPFSWARHRTVAHALQDNLGKHGPGALPNLKH